MKRIAFLLLLPVMLVALAACGGDDDSSGDTAGGDTTNGETVTPAAGSDTDRGDGSGANAEDSSGQEESSNPTPDPSLFDMDAAETTDSGLMIIEEAEGDGMTAQAQDSVVVHYRGMLTDGTEFDSSYSRGEPTEFPLSQVIPGFAEGITGMAEGGKRILYIPSELGYGDQANGPIPAGSDLIFEVELIEVIR